MDRETLLMLLDPRSPLKGRSPLPNKVTDTDKTEENDDIVPQRLTFDDSEKIQMPLLRNENLPDQ